MSALQPQLGLHCSAAAPGDDSRHLVSVRSLSQSQPNVLSSLDTLLNGKAVQNILSKIPEKEQCRANSGTFIRSCSKDLISTTTLKDNTATLLGLVSFDQASNTLKIKGNQLSGFIDGATASDECCRAACEVSKKGCLCNSDAWGVLKSTFNLDGDNGVNSVFAKMGGKCKSDSRKFEVVMDPSSASCAKENIPNAKC